MAERIETKVFVHQLALRMQTEDTVAAAWLAKIRHRRLLTGTHLRTIPRWMKKSSPSDRSG